MLADLADALSLQVLPADLGVDDDLTFLLWNSITMSEPPNRKKRNSSPFSRRAPTSGVRATEETTDIPTGSTAGLLQTRPALRAALQRASRPLGIEKGKPFKPDERQRRILTQATLVGEAMAKANDFDKRQMELSHYSSTGRGRCRTSRRQNEQARRPTAEIGSSRTAERRRRRHATAGPHRQVAARLARRPGTGRPCGRTPRDSRRSGRARSRRAPKARRAGTRPRGAPRKRPG